jgi:hypothetical protein
MQEDNPEKRLERTESELFEFNTLEISKIGIKDPESQYIDIEPTPNDLYFKKMPLAENQNVGQIHICSPWRESPSPFEQPDNSKESERPDIEKIIFDSKKRKKKNSNRTTHLLSNRSENFSNISHPRKNKSKRFQETQMCKTNRSIVRGVRGSKNKENLIQTQKKFHDSIDQTGYQKLFVKFK